MELADFLLARIAEDEVANAPGPEPEAWCDRNDGLHLAYSRVLAECHAKREIVDYENGPDQTVLLLLAEVYRDHPDYDETWIDVNDAAIRRAAEETGQ